MSQDVSGDDMFYMKQMKCIQENRMNDHIEKYDKLQRNMVNLSDKAIANMHKIAKYDAGSKQIAEKASEQQRHYK